MKLGIGSGRVLAALLVIVSSGSAAQRIPGYPDDVRAMDPRDVALLPPFCRVTQDFREKLSGYDTTQHRRWEDTLGPTFIHLHHYCYGLMKANRGLFLASTPLAKTHYLNDALIEFDYVIDRVSGPFILLPEVLARRGQVQLHLGQVVAGNESIEKAISIKPDYWLPYAMASDFYKSSGETSRAREWLQRGLQAAPGVQALEQRLAAIDVVARQPAGAKK